MNKTGLCKMLLGWGMASLLLAGCGSDGGGGGGGGATPATITNAANAKGAAGSATVAFSSFTGGLSGLVGSVPGAPAPRLSRSQRLAANFTAKNLPQAAAATQAVAALRANRLAATVGKAVAQTIPCASGSMTIDTTGVPGSGNWSEETIFASCGDGSGFVINGREKHSETVTGTSIAYADIFGDGDETLEATDLVISGPNGLTFTQTGTETNTVSLTSGTVDAFLGNGNAGFSETSSMKSKLSFKSTTPAADLNLAISMTSSDSATLAGNGIPNSSYTITGNSSLNGSMSVAGTGGGQSVNLVLSADNASERFTEKYDAATTPPTTTSTSAPDGKLSITLTPASCFDGVFDFETVVPIKTVESGATVTTVEGDIIINGNTHFIYSNNNVTITLNGTTVFSGTEDALYAELDDACPLFAVLQP